MGDDGAVTVVVPTRNRGSVLPLTLASILSQVDVAVSVVVVDDSSADDSGEWLRSFPDPRLRVIQRDRPGGPAAARNDGMAAAHTRWVAFCDDDDLWAPSKLAAQLAALEAKPHARWSCTGTVSVDESLAVVGSALRVRARNRISHVVASLSNVPALQTSAAAAALSSRSRV